MNPRLREPASQQPPTATVAEPITERAARWLLAGLVAVCVARPLVPSEGVAWMGDGHAFTMLLLMLSVGYLLLAARRGWFASRFHIVDAAVALLVLFSIASSAVGFVVSFIGGGNVGEFQERVTSPRIAINMSWEWLGLGLVYFLTRQLVTERWESRGLVTVMIALAAALSALGLYQVNVALPAERAAYEANPDQVLLDLGQWYPEGSPERMRFEARLAGNEPLATFALTNSLAGVLVTWLIAALAVAWRMIQFRRSPVDGTALVRYSGLAVVLAMMTACLLMTNSRSALAALAAGLVLLPLVAHAWRRAIPGKWIAVAAAILATGGVALALGLGAGRGPLAAASRSLQYRFEYWEATLDMIAKFPVLGVGPGEFQNYYTQFKLPEASEEVRDPHNFILEIWATGGTLAFLALVAVLAGFALASYEATKREPEVDELEAEQPARPADALWLPLLGALAAIPLASAAGLPFGFALAPLQMAIVAGTGAVTIAVLWPWMSRGQLPVLLPALGLTVLMIHLLASGGISFPGVAYSFWTLVALGVNVRIQSESKSSRVAPNWPWARAVPIACCAVALAATVACYSTAFLPVLSLRAAMARAANVELADETRFAALTQASIADRWSTEPWMGLAQLSAERLLENPSADLWRRRFAMATTGAIQLDGHSSAMLRQLADLHRQVYQVTPEPELAESVLRLLSNAAQLYPNSAVVAGDYALALDLVGQDALARRTASRALELDELTPHQDKKLSDEVRNRLREIVQADDEE